VAENNDVFRADPVRLIRVFRHGQTLEATLDLHLAELIRSSLGLLTPKVAQSPDASVCFRAILSEAGAVHPVLARMHELGVLGRFIQEFDGLTCLVQHEYYHRYTADVHTLNAIRELDRIYTEAEPIMLKYRAALHETTDPSLLYLTLLLHDIGKAEGIQGHADSGVRIALPLLERFGVEPADRELVAFVIKNHLAMARFWQKRDVDDPSTATAFAELVGDAERLRYLYVHTFCDARGTAADLWNSYKDTLHTTLYRATFERLKQGDAFDASLQQKKLMTQQELIAKTIPGISPDEINAHFGLLPDRYFIHTDSEEIALHIQMVNRLLKSITTADSVGSLRPIIEWKDDLNRSLTVVNVVTWDRAGLFDKLAGAFSMAGLSILGAKVISRTDHIAIDTFYVVEPGRGAVQSATAQEKFARTIEDALVSEPRPVAGNHRAGQEDRLHQLPQLARAATPCTARFPRRSMFTTSFPWSAPSSRSRRATRSACSTASPVPSRSTTSTSPSPASARNGAWRSIRSTSRAPTASPSRTKTGSSSCATP
jgi:[protein-PII] uridylyltransferase